MSSSFATTENITGKKDESFIISDLTLLHFHFPLVISLEMFHKIINKISTEFQIQDSRSNKKNWIVKEN